MTYLYVHTAPNGKRYVGIADNCEARWEVGGHGYADNEAFYKDILFYGWDNIKHEIIEKFSDRKDAEKYEALYIILFNTENPEMGYNRTSIKQNLYHRYEKRQATYTKKKSKTFQEYTSERNDIMEKYNMPWSALSVVIDEWVFNEKHREMLKRRIHDGLPFSELAKEFHLSLQQCKTIIYRGLSELDRHI